MVRLTDGRTAVAQFRVEKSKLARQAVRHAVSRKREVQSG